MTFRQGMILYACTALVMLPLDVLWLGTVGRTFYKQQLGDLLADKPALFPAAAFYLIYALGVVAFVVAPALRDGSWATAFGWGALFGLCAYATYDLSNLATLRGFPSTLAVVDMAWGAGLTAVTAALVVALARRFGWA